MNSIAVPASALQPPGAGKRTLAQAFGWAALILLLGWAWQGADMRPLDLAKDSGNMRKFLAEFFPPNFREWRSYLREIVTVHIAIWGTALALVTRCRAGCFRRRTSCRGGSTSRYAA